MKIERIAFVALTLISQQMFNAKSFAVEGVPSTGTGADDCSPEKEYDIGDQFGPIRNQSRSGGLCYAYVAADLLGHAIGYRGAHQVSARQMAEVFNSTSYSEGRAAGAPNPVDHALAQYTESPTTTGGGFTDSTINVVSARGRICTEADYPSDYVNNRSSYRTSPYRLRPIDAERIDQLPGWRHAAARARIEQIHREKCYLESNLSRISVTTVANDPEKLRIEANKNFSSRRPFSVSFDAGLPEGRVERTAHTAIVVGRKKIAGVCNIKVRNSHGPNWSKCRSPVTCTNGYFWIPENLLFSKAEDITTVNLTPPNGPSNTSGNSSNTLGNGASGNR